MSTPDDLKQQLEDNMKALIEGVYQEQSIEVSEFLYDPLWYKEGKTIGGRFKAKNGNTYIFIKKEGELQLLQEQEES